MKDWERDLGVEVAKSIIGPKIPWMAKGYEQEIYDWLPEVVQSVVESIDQAREMRAKAEAKKDEKK